jgi:hypothetical protein
VHGQAQRGLRLGKASVAAFQRSEHIVATPSVPLRSFRNMLLVTLGGAFHAQSGKCRMHRPTMAQGWLKA